KRIGTRKRLGVDDVVEEFGFTTMIPEELSVVEQIRHFMCADIVLYPHGANSTNSLYMHPGSVFIEAFSKRWALPICVHTLALKDVDFFPLVETPIAKPVEPSVLADFHVDNTILRMMIRSAIKLAEKNASDRENGLDASPVALAQEADGPEEQA
ncbi:MAG: glycosyltransferase family 61 protein, partial [Atopobiaceae bacterium]|nr:glycosyltransferase family 61 protein [Atopobiaceae bacterium]